MTSGGARSRSGPTHDPKSARSESRGLTTMAVLKAEGYQGRVPGLNQFLPNPTRRHREVWAQLWRTPQASVWIRESWRYQTVADLVRRQVQQEAPDAPGWVAPIVLRLRDQLGLSYDGLRAAGWEIPTGVAVSPAPEPGAAPAAGDEVGQKRVRRSQTLHEE